MLRKLAFVLTITTIAGAASPSQAMPIQPPADGSSMVIQVANGCGRGGYRGPNGACHSFGTGPYPRGYFGPYHNAWRWNGCPRGYWRGPWGHCRDTPYHGRLPGGGWK
jgi:hypothetical protein